SMPASSRRPTPPPPPPGSSSSSPSSSCSRPATTSRSPSHLAPSTRSHCSRVHLSSQGAALLECVNQFTSSSRPGRHTRVRRMQTSLCWHNLSATGTVSAVWSGRDDERGRVERSYLRFAGVGVQYGLTVLFMTLLGIWLDKRFGTAPLLL